MRNGKSRVIVSVLAITAVNGCGSQDVSNVLQSPDRPSTYCASSVDSYASYTISQIENPSSSAVNVKEVEPLGQADVEVADWSLIPLPIEQGQSLPANGKGRILPISQITTRTATPHTTLFISVVLRWHDLRPTPSFVNGLQLVYKDKGGSTGSVRTNIRLGASSTTTGCELSVSATN